MSTHFTGYPRVMACFDKDTTIFELFRCQRGRSLSIHELKAVVAHLDPKWNWWIERTTSPRELISDRPSLVHPRKRGGRPVEDPEPLETTVETDASTETVSESVLQP